MVTMADTIDIMGKPVKKPVVIAAGVGVIALAAILYSRQKKAAAAAAAAAAAPADPNATAATDTSGLDPATGLPLGSAQDLSALSAQSAGYYGTTATGTTSVTPQGYTNNAQWAQAAEAYITGGSGGGAADPVGNALGKYISGQGLTADQQSIVEQAIAFEGYPPVAGAEGYPPNIRTVSTPPVKSATQVTVPNVKGMDVEQAGVTLRAAGLKMNGPAGVPHKIHVVVSTSPAIGSKVNTGTTVKISNYSTR